MIVHPGKLKVLPQWFEAKAKMAERARRTLDREIGSQQYQRAMGQLKASVERIEAKRKKDQSVISWLVGGMH